MSNEEKKDIEDKINDAMAKIVSDTVGDVQPEKKSDPSASHVTAENSKSAGHSKSARPSNVSHARSARPSGGSGTSRSGRPSGNGTVTSKSARPKKISYVPIDESEFAPIVLPKKKKHKALRVTGMIAAMVLVAAGCAYAGVSYYYTNHFFEGTTINGINCSGKTSEEAEQAVAKKAEDYLLEVKARNLKSQSINGKLIGYRYVSDGSISQYLDEQKPYKWVRGFWKKQNYTAKENMTYDKVKLKEQLEKLECVKKENQTAPEDAYVAYKDSKFEIVPETEGNTLDFNGAYRALSEAVASKKRTIDLNSCPAVYVKAAVMKDDPDLKNSLEECQNLIRTKIVYIFGEETVTLEGDEIRNWLIFDERGRLQKNEDELRQCVAEYVAQLAATHDTVNTERKFCTTNGRTVQVYSSVYGWKIDQEKEIETIMQEMIAGVQINREPVYAMRANARGMNDIGNTYIEVDLSAQHLYYYQDGSIILESDIVSGDMQYAERQTPPGIFQLYYKKSPSVLKGKMLENGKYEYERPVTYWMPFNGGIGFHDASWQPYFGGNRFREGGGSHGCINLPADKAAELYNRIDESVPIVCFY